MIHSSLESQAKNTDGLLDRFIEERDEKKLDTTSANPSSSSRVVNFTQINPHTRGPSVLMFLMQLYKRTELSM
jgi:hypothetical protein